MHKVWEAKWIMDSDFYGISPCNVFHKQKDPEYKPQKHREDLLNRHMLIRKKFTVGKDFSNAVIYITADDYYKLYINGTFVGQGPAPSYHFHYYYNRYDVSKYLVQGENVVAVHVYYQGLVNRVWNSGDYRQGMIAEVYVDGKLAQATDSSWKYTRTNAYATHGTIAYDTQFSEDIDSRLIDVMWRNADYDDSNWMDAFESITDDHKLFLQETSPVAVYEVKPEVCKMIKPGHYFIDFGHEITGQFKMNASGNQGDAIEIRCGEETEEGQPDRVRYKLRCNAEYKESWILSGKGVDALEFFDYKAFRYVEVEGPEYAVKPSEFAAIVRHYPVDDNKCTLEASDTILEKVWTICKNGVKYGTQEGYLDCPSREKGQYLGDATVTAQSHVYVSGDLRLFKKEIKDFAHSSIVCKGIMAVAPGSYMQEIADYSMQWPMQLLAYYKHSGDIGFLRQMYPVLLGLADYFRKYEREDGLIENSYEKWNLVDWPVNLRDGYDFNVDKNPDTGCHNVANAFYYGMLKDINEIKDILGIPYENTLDRYKDAFVKAFYRKETQLFADAEHSRHSALHSNILPLLFGIVPKEDKGAIVDLIRKKGLCCGVYMAYFVLKALAQAEEYGIIYDIITSEDIHSWGNMIKEGATTCFEAWGKDQKKNTSLCHPWASAPISVIIEDITGLKPGLPGWKEIIFTPHLPDKLKKFKLNVPVNTGNISVVYIDGEIQLHVPAGIPVKCSDNVKVVYQ